MFNIVNNDIRTASAYQADVEFVQFKQIELRLQKLTSIISSIQTIEQSARWFDAFSAAETELLSSTQADSPLFQKLIKQATELRLRHFLATRFIVEREFDSNWKKKQEFYKYSIPPEVNRSILAQILRFNGAKNYIDFVKSSTQGLLQEENVFNKVELSQLANYVSKKEEWKQLFFVRLCLRNSVNLSLDYVTDISKGKADISFRALMLISFMLNNPLNKIEHVYSLLSKSILKVLKAELKYLSREHAYDLASKIADSRVFEIRELVCLLSEYHPSSSFFHLLMNNSVKDVSGKVKSQAFESLANNYKELLELELCSDKYRAQYVGKLKDYFSKTDSLQKSRAALKMAPELKMENISRGLLNPKKERQNIFAQLAG